MIVLGYIIQNLSYNKHFELIEYDCNFQSQSVEPKQSFGIHLLIENYGKNNIRNLIIKNLVDKDINIQKCSADNIKTLKDVCVQTIAVSMKRRERLNLYIKAHIDKRGVYKLHGCEMLMSDFLGFYNPKDTKVVDKEIVVYPSRLENNEFNMVLSSIMGRISVKKNIFEDPTLILGYRDYTGIEPLKSISWSQTAKRGNLIVKQYDCTQEPYVIIVLDSSYKNDFGRTHRYLEGCYSIVRGMSEVLMEKGISYMFITNNKLVGENNGIIDYSHDVNLSNQNKRLLEILGRCEYNFRYNCESLFLYLKDIIYKSSFKNSSIIYISTSECKETDMQISKFKKKFNIDVTTLYASNYVDFEEGEV